MCHWNLRILKSQLRQSEAWQNQNLPLTSPSKKQATDHEVLSRQNEEGLQAARGGGPEGENSVPFTQLPPGKNWIQQVQMIWILKRTISSYKLTNEHPASLWEKSIPGNCPCWGHTRHPRTAGSLVQGVLLLPACQLPAASILTVNASPGFTGLANEPQWYQKGLHEGWQLAR